MTQPKTKLSKYFTGAIIVLVAYVAGFFTPRILPQSQLNQLGQVSIAGPVANLALMGEAVNKVRSQLQLDKSVRLDIRQETQGDKGLQYAVSLNGTLETVADDVVQYVNYIISVPRDPSKNPLAADVTKLVNQKVDYLVSGGDKNLDGMVDANELTVSLLRE